jgi:hypothetical protein
MNLVSCLWMQTFCPRYTYYHRNWAANSFHAANPKQLITEI